MNALFFDVNHFLASISPRCNLLRCEAANYTEPFSSVNPEF